MVSTVEPGRKPIDDECGNGDLPNGDIKDILDMVTDTNDDKRPTNGTSEKHSENNTNEQIADEVPSSSGTSQITTESDVKKEDVKKEIDEPIVEKAIESETSASKLSDEEMPDKATLEIKTENVEIKSDESIDKVAAVKDETDEITAAEVELNVTPETIAPNENVADKADNKEETTVENNDEKKDGDKELKVDESVKESKEIEKPPTPKHARSTSDDEDEGDLDNDSKNPRAKKIRLELDDEVKQVDEKTVSQASIEPSIDTEVDLQKEADLLAVISSEIDAQKENELLEDVVDAALAVEKVSNNADSKPIAENIIVPEVLKESKEDTSVAEDLLKTNEPVALPSDLDFTPDEALNELVSSDILSVIPEQPAEEVKMNDESAAIAETAAPPDEMNVENTETNTLEVENAMESAPIKVDEEKMDVDESNSVDAMDL